MATPHVIASAVVKPSFCHDQRVPSVTNYADAAREVGTQLPVVLDVSGSMSDEFTGRMTDAVPGSAPMGHDMSSRFQSPRWPGYMMGLPVR